MLDRSHLHSRSGLTLFNDLLKKIFSRNLVDELPTRVLPISAVPPTDIATLFETEVNRIKQLLRPGGRRRIEAIAKIRSLAILEGSIRGEKLQPGDGELKKFAATIQSGQGWDKIFPGVASIEFTATGYGPSLDLRISKKEGIPVQLVPEGTPGATVVAIKRVDELAFYNLNLTQLADKVGLSGPKTLALIRYLNLDRDNDCFKQILIGKSKFNRYSQKTLDRIKKELPTVSMEKVWAQYGQSRKNSQ